MTLVVREGGEVSQMPLPTAIDPLPRARSESGEHHGDVYCLAPASGPRSHGHLLLALVELGRVGRGGMVLVQLAGGVTVAPQQVAPTRDEAGMQLCVRFLGVCLNKGSV